MIRRLGIQRFGDQPIQTQKYHARPGAYAILPLKRRVLLTGQMGNGIDIQLPGGGIDPGESPVQALHREVREETGWAIAKPRRLGAFRRFVYMPEYEKWAEKICHIYVARPTRQISDPIEAEHVTLVLSPQDAAEMLCNDGDSMFLRTYFRIT